MKRLIFLCFFYIYGMCSFVIGQNSDILQSLLFFPETSREYHVAKQQWPTLLIEEKLPYLPRLLEGIKHSELLTRKNAIWALAYLGEHAKSAVNDLLPMLQDKEVAIRREVIVTLGSLGDPTVAEALIPFLEETDILSQKQAMISLYQLGFNQESARDVLIQGLYHTHWKIRHGTSLILIEIGKQDSLLFSKIFPKLQDPDPEIRFAIVRIFSLTGLLEKEVVEGLFQALNDPIEKVSQEAMLAIYRIQGKQANSALALPFLKNLLTAENKLWKYAAAHVLSTFPDEAESIVPLLISGIQDPDEKIRSFAIIALGNTASTSPEVIASLKKTLQDPSKSIRQQGLRALHVKGESAREALEEMKAMLNDSDPVVRLYARQVIQKFQEPVSQENKESKETTTEKKE